MIRANGPQFAVNTSPLRLDGFASLGIRRGDAGYAFSRTVSVGRRRWYRHPTGADHRSDQANGAAAEENDLRIIPNPVADRTELRYTAANEGRVRLEITDASGRIALTREEGRRAAGSFMYVWDTTQLAPGSYICTLYVNDEFVVKKSVKLGQR